jgi:hypothetical protein
MGIYLSKPDTTIEAEEGSAGNLRYGVADMQVIHYVSQLLRLWPQRSDEAAP